MKIARIILFLVVCIVICSLLYIFRQYGVVSDGGKTDFNTIDEPSNLFSLEARDCRVRQGEVIPYSKLASAVDCDGQNISSHIVFMTDEGKILQGNVDTKTPGIYSVQIRVKSLVSSKTIQKNITLLVDGSVN